MTTVDKKAQVQEFYGTHARAYTTSTVHAQGASLERLVAQVAPRGHERVLDVATGTGHNALSFAPHVRQVIGLDLTAAMLAFYDWNPKARNYGGSTQGLRWLFWLIPFWMIALPPGVEPGQERKFYRALTLLALMASVYSVGYAIRHPWSHPWIVDLMEQLQLYSLRR